MVGHIFISYAHEDKEYCEKLAQALEGHGLEFWYDQGIRQGHRWDDAIDEHIATCAIFLVLSSKASARSGSFVKNEVIHAGNHHKAIWLLRLDTTPFLTVEANQGADVFDRSLPGESWFAELRNAVHEVLQTFLHPTRVRSFGKSDGLRVAACSPDGRWIAAAGRSHRVRLHNERGEIQTVGEGTSFDGKAAEALAVWSPDGTRLLTGEDDGPLLIWSVDGHAASPIRIPPVHAHDGRVRVAAWSPDGTAIAFVGRHGGARVLTPGQAGEGAHLTEYQGQICALAWSPDGTSVTTGHDDGRLWQFDARNGKPIREPVAGHADRQTQRINCIAWSPLASTLATAGDDGALMVWEWDPDKATEPRRRHLGGHVAPVWGLAWSPDGRYLATAGGDRRVCLWDLQTGFQFDVPHPQQVWSVSWSGNRRLVTVSADGEAHIWSLWTGQRSQPA